MTDESTSAPSPIDGDLSDEQQKLLIVIGICSASLSVIGSTAIVLKIMRGFRSMTPYDRIVLGMSACDIFASIKMASDNFLVPSETQKVWAFGNQATCKAAAFVNASIVWALWYNAMLSLYFLLMVLSQVRQKEYVRKSELWMHLSGLYFPIVSIVGLFLGWYGVVEGSYCDIRDQAFELIVSVFPALLSFLLIIVDYSLICAVVRKSLQSNNGSQKRLKKETTTLMILYVGSIIVVWGPLIVVYSFLIQVLGYTPSEIYPLVVLEAISIPLQGFLNAFIYFKPAYTRFRIANPNKTMRFVLYQTLFNRNAPKSNYHHRNAQHVTHGSAYNITDITRSDPSGTDPSASNPIMEEDVGVGITGIDFEQRLFFHSDVPAENNDSPLEGVGEENDDSPNSNP